MRWDLLAEIVITDKRKEPFTFFLNSYDENGIVSQGEFKVVLHLLVNMDSSVHLANSFFFFSFYSLTTRRAGRSGPNSLWREKCRRWTSGKCWCYHRAWNGALWNDLLELYARRLQPAKLFLSPSETKRSVSVIVGPQLKKTPELERSPPEVEKEGENTLRRLCCIVLELPEQCRVWVCVKLVGAELWRSGL